MPTRKEKDKGTGVAFLNTCNGNIVWLRHFNIAMDTASLYEQQRHCLDNWEFQQSRDRANSDGRHLNAFRVKSWIPEVENKWNMEGERACWKLDQ